MYTWTLNAALSVSLHLPEGTGCFPRALSQGGLDLDAGVALEWPRRWRTVDGGARSGCLHLPSQILMHEFSTPHGMLKLWLSFCR